MEELGLGSLLFSAKGVRISLGGKDRFRVSRKSPAYHIIADLVLDDFRNHAAYRPIRILGFGRSGLLQRWFRQDEELGFGRVPFMTGLNSQPHGCEPMNGDRVRNVIPLEVELFKK